MFSMSAHVVTSRVPVIRYRLKPCAPYISPPTVITNFTKERLSSSLEHRYGPEKLRRRLKLVRGIAKMPYYTVACLLRSPYFVTFTAL